MCPWTVAKVLGGAAGQETVIYTTRFRNCMVVSELWRYGHTWGLEWALNILNGRRCFKRPNPFFHPLALDPPLYLTHRRVMSEHQYTVFNIDMPLHDFLRDSSIISVAVYRVRSVILLSEEASSGALTAVYRVSTNSITTS